MLLPAGLKHASLMKKILVLCPARREYRDLPAIARSLGCELVFDDFGGDYFDRFLQKNPPVDFPSLDILSLIDATVERYRHAGLSGITSGVGYPGMSAASIIGERLGLPGPRPSSVLCCEHKYYSRVAQQQFVPEAVPAFQLLDREGSGDDKIVLPVFVKPVKSCMSINAHRVDSHDQLRTLARSATMPDGFVRPFNDMMRLCTNNPLDASHLMVETLLEGAQVSLEGYVFDGRVHVMGILDAIMFPGDISFKRFQYPSSLSVAVQARMRDIAQRFLAGIGYDNAPFNIELFHDTRTDRIHIIEVNPKLASQFPDLFHKVDGHSSWTVLLQLAMGEEPVFANGQGKFRIAGSCVLRTFEDRRVLSVPAEQSLRALAAEFPDALIEIYATPGLNLSDQMQDSHSFRYGLVNIGADSVHELESKFAGIQSRLDFKFAPIAAAVDAAAC